MLAYKFRPASHFDYALDIIFKQRLYCSDWSRLNDPMEGMFGYSTDANDCKKIVDDIISFKKRLRVCSLSATYDCHLLWAHYASGFDGLAIEVELPDHSPSVKRIKYRGVFEFITMEHGIDAMKAAETILSSKYNEWSYEKEIRILQEGEWYTLNAPISKVIAGHRMKPSLLEALRIICKNKGVDLRMTGIGDEGIDADHVPL